jgi:hypothetical protein
VEIDWSTAEVKAPREGQPFVLQVEITGRPDKAFRDAWERETNELASAPGDARRTIGEWMSGSRGIGIHVSPINPDDPDEERRILEDLVARANRAAEPLRAKYNEEDDRRRDEQAARAAKAQSLTDQFRRGT